MSFPPLFSFVKSVGGEHVAVRCLAPTTDQSHFQPGPADEILVGKAIKLHRRAVICACQGFVGSTMVFHGDVHGVPMSRGTEPPPDVQEN